MEDSGIPAILPSDAEELGKLPCAYVNLDCPGMEELKRLTARGQYAAALSAPAQTFFCKS